MVGREFSRRLYWTKIVTGRLPNFQSNFPRFPKTPRPGWISALLPEPAMEGMTAKKRRTLTEGKAAPALGASSGGERHGLQRGFFQETDQLWLRPRQKCEIAASRRGKFYRGLFSASAPLLSCG